MNKTNKTNKTVFSSRGFPRPRRRVLQTVLKFGMNRP